MYLWACWLSFILVDRYVGFSDNPIWLLIDHYCRLTCVKQMGRTPGYLCPQ